MILSSEGFANISQLHLLEIQIQLQKELDPNVGGGSGLLHMVCLVRNYTYTTTKNEGKVVQKKSSKDEKRGLSSFNLVQIQVGRIMKQQAFLGKKLFESRLAPIKYCQQTLGSQSN